MFSIRTLNEISSAIFDHLPGEQFEVSATASLPDGIIVRSADCKSMEFADNLLAIARAGAGVNNIPIDRCGQKGIVVFNTPGANANAVKELVLTGILAASRNLVDACCWAQTLKGQDGVPALVEKGKSQFIGREVRGRTVGVIGLGAIGVGVANDCHAIGMNVLGFDPFISVENAWGLSRAVHRAASLEELITKSDYITLHIPLMEKTKGYLNARLCSLFKKGAVLLNFARAELVDPLAVLASLSAGILAKYVVDFPTEEVLGVPGVMAIPHLGASTPESEENCAHMAAAQLADYLLMGNICNSVNLPDCQMPVNGGQRVCIINSNRANMVGQITAVLAGQGANIANMINRSKGDIAYTLIDLDSRVDDAVRKTLDAIDGVIRVRLIG